jgi:hypothetical protein
MKKAIVVWILVLGMVCPSVAADPVFEFGQSLEVPEWGMIEWSSASLPRGFWYPSFDFRYATGETYFSAGKELDYEEGRDSAAYVLEVGLAYGLTDKLSASIHVPFVLSQKVAIGRYGARHDSISGVSGIGDVEVALKYHLVDRYFWSVAGQVGSTLPTGIPHNKVSSVERATGDGQTDLNLALNGDILLTEESFLSLGGRFAYQFKRSYRDKNGESVDEKLGNGFGLHGGGVKNFTNVGIGGALQYTFWQATKVDKQVMTGSGDLFSLFLQFSLGNLKPEKHGRLDFTLDLPITGKNAPATYRLGVSLKTVFR